MNIIFDKNNIQQKAIEALNTLIAATAGKPTLLLLSGGSSLNLLNDVKGELLHPNITAGMLDDRYSHDTSINSFGLLQNTAFYKKGIEKGVTFLNSQVLESETLVRYADRYQSYILKWLESNPDGIILATVGIGPDGHTSGILPFPEDPATFEELFNKERLIVGYDAGDKSIYRYRMTSTFTFMRKCQHIVTYMTGENKKLALQSVMNETGTLAETPGRIIRELPDVTIYTDIEI